MENLPETLAAKFAFCSIQAYAAHSYLYYDRNESLISDGEFDAICRWLEVNFGWVKPHDINGYLDQGKLAAGTGYGLNVCGQTKNYAELLLQNAQKKGKTVPVKAPDPEPKRKSIFD